MNYYLCQNHVPPMHHDKKKHKYGGALESYDNVIECDGGEKFVPPMQDNKN